MAEPNTSSHSADRDVIFTPLKLSKNLTIKNRLLRSSISGMFDDYNGHGGNARLNWEEKFARGGIGAIISAFTPVAVSGRILVRYAMIDNNNKLGFWKELARRIHQPEYSGCKYIMQLSHSGRQQDMGGIENLFWKPLSSTNTKDFFHGILSQAMTQGEIDETVQSFADGAWRAREAGLDGVELHGSNGYLLTQFLSSGINDRDDGYGGAVENRTRFVLEVVRAIRKKVGRDFHLQMKINGVDHNNWLYPWLKPGNSLEETLKICEILRDNGEGVDAFHVSSGSTFPHPRNPPGDFPLLAARRWYDGMLSSGVRTIFPNYIVFRSRILGWLFRRWWIYRRGPLIEGINASYARAIKKHFQDKGDEIPILCTGGFQHASVIAELIRDGWCDGVTMARPLIANNDLPKILMEKNGPDAGKECSYCNKCLVNDIENPLGCYELSRYDGATFDKKYQNMMESIMSVFDPPTY